MTRVGPSRYRSSPEDEAALLDRLFDEYYDEQLEVWMPADYPEGEQIYVGRAVWSG